MAEIRSLEHRSLDELHTAFTSAFADYMVPMCPRPQDLEYMLQRRGYAGHLSFGAFENGRIVSLTLNGTGEWNGVPTAYDTGTGTIAEHRRKGLAAAIFEASLPVLRQHGITQYLLEVMQENTKAADLYLKTGFEVTREFDYYTQPIEKHDLATAATGSEFTIKEMAPCWPQLTAMWDMQPSWQNSSASVMRMPRIKCYGIYAGNELAGYATVDLVTGDVSQLAVALPWRRRGVGTALINFLRRQIMAPIIRFANLDSRDAGARAFMLNSGMQAGHLQFEMMLKL